MIKRLGASVVVWFLATACGEGAPTPLLDIGDPCRSAAEICVDDELVEVCEDEVWAIVSCDQLCAELGPAWIGGGCDDSCVCTPADPNGCTPGASTCVDDDRVGTCDETQTWEEVSCEELCADQGLNSAGCREGDAMWMKPDECWCTTEGTTCSAGAEPNCVNDQILASCEGEVWVFEDCAQSCGGSGSCDPFAEVDICSCP